MLAGFVILDIGLAFATASAGAAVQLLIVLHNGTVYGGIQRGSRVLEQLFGRLGGKLFEGGESTAGEELFHIGGNVHRGEVLVGELQVVLLQGTLAVEFHQGHGFFLVQFHHIVLVKFLHIGQYAFQRGGGVFLQGTAIGVHHAHIQAEKLNAIRGLGDEGDGAVGGRIGLYVFGDVLNGSAVLFGAGGIGGNPGFQLGLFLLFAADDVQVLEGQFLTLPFLPAVGAAGIFVGILELDGRVCAHGLPHHILAHGAGIDADAVGGNHFLQLGGGLVTLGAAGITHDHGVAVLRRSGRGDLEAAGGLVGHVVRAVGGGHIVLAGIHAEHGEVAGVTGPHPVVRLSAELAHMGRRGSHETDVRVGAVYNEVEYVAVIEGGNLHAAAGVHLFGGLHQVGAGGFGILGLFHDAGYIFH